MKLNFRTFPLLPLTPIACLLASGQLLISSAGAADSVSIDDVSLIEGDSGASTLIFTVTRTTNAAGFSLNWATADGIGASAAIAPGDYTAGSGTLNFQAGGALTGAVSVTINADTTAEPHETFFVNLSGFTITAGEARITDAQGLGTITEDDGVAPVITTQPAATLTAVAGTNFALTAAAAGDVPPNFQWYLGTPGVITTPVSGATSATLTTSTAINRTYWVRAINPKGTADSTSSSVTVPSATNALLASLTLNAGTISPAFNPVTFAYSASQAESVTSVIFGCRTKKL